MVSTSSANWTPRILDGKVFDIAEVGNTVVVGGRFTTVAESNGSNPRARDSVLAFSAGSGQVNNAFDPVLTGDVNAVEPGPTPGTVYVGGSFSGIDGRSGKLFVLDTGTGAVVNSFSAPGLNGVVNDVIRVGDQLLVAGTFTRAFQGGTHERLGLMSLNAATGALNGFLDVSLEGHHNWSEGSNGAKAAVGPKAIAISPDGATLVAVGNFTEADAEPRDQAAMIDLSGAQAVVADWRTRGYEPSCASGAFDTYMRDVAFAPDGSYFSIATTGGPFPGTLCDTVTRFATQERGQEVDPEWLNESGGDTLLSVASSGEAVYTGGHQRWLNNTGGRDRAVAGSVPRPGIGAVDPRNGVPVAWNPGRNPRGVGAEALTVTSEGLWVGHDTSWIGNYQQRRPGIAYFPVAGGTDVTDPEPYSLPAGVFQHTSVASGDVLYRVNTGGPSIPAFDGGPSWRADTDASSDVRNSGSNAAGYGPVPTVTPNVPSSAPRALYESERWDPNGDPEMEWAFPVEQGEDVTVRLYLANRCTCTDDPGERRFDVQLDGATVLDDYDISGDVGHDVGTMKSFDITSDGVVNIRFGHVTENPLINGIEIVAAGSGEPEPDAGLATFWYTGGEVASQVEPVSTSGLDWSEVRGATLVGDTLFYASADGEFYRRSFDGDTLGAPQVIDPYNDPFWSDVETGSGQTYRGVRPSFYGEVPNLTGMAYLDGKLYYTRAGSDQIYVRGFSPDSGIVTSLATNLGGVSFDDPAGLFFDASGEALYVANGVNGELSRVDWADGAASGTPEVISGPDVDGHNWASRVLFLGPGEPANLVPESSFTSESNGLNVMTDASASTDSDGEIVSYSWEFGDGSTAEGVSAEHTYSDAGDYTITLTVTDDDGATSTATETVTVEPLPNVEPQAVFSITTDDLDIQFDASESTDEDGEIVSYEWDFGDDSTGDGVTVEHTYAEAGEYSVSLTVTDDDGASTTVSQTVTVTAANVEPEAAFVTTISDLMVAFEASDSDDVDGEIVDYAWDFGDGETGEGLAVEHTYADGGTFTVTLTVTDDDGATGSVSEEITVEPANVAPAAEFSVASDGLSVNLDAGSSEDPDGEIVEYAWDFGDGESDAGAQVQHDYAAEGTYTVTLTVTDNDGATGTATREVTVPQAGVEAPSYVGNAAWIGHSMSANIDLPDTIEEGDLLLAYVTMSGPRDISGPVGVGDWDEVVTTNNGSLNVHAYSRVATGVEAGETVSMSFGQWTRADVTVLVYRNVSADPIEVFAERASNSTTDFPSPEVDVPGDDRLLVTHWSDRSSSTTAWTAPDGVAVRSTQVGQGGGRVSSLVVDETADAGTYPGLLAKTTPSSPRGLALTLALAPGSSPAPPNQAPEARITFPPCQQLTCTFNGEGSSDVDGDVESYAWDFGDDETATGQSVEHTFASAGTYTVTLEVTDDEGATGATTQEVTVSDAPAATPAIVDIAAVNGNGRSISAQLPADIEADDQIFAFLALSGERDIDDPVGVGAWEVEHEVANGPQNVTVFSRVADGSEGGKVISLDLTSYTQGDLTVMVYRGAASAGVEAVASEIFRNQVNHVSPEIQVTGDQRRVVSYWSDRSGSTTGWNAPLGVNVQSTQAGTGGGRVSSLVVDDRASTGDYGGLTARTVPQEAPRGIALTLSLPPADAP